ncbi:MAG TPA: MBL fold metallo-hydrolase [Candidatus Limnocylindria bacterium]|nr:MBL fold metallo-hydrolase [Candidatus Limnocylindria bacterium]
MHREGRARGPPPRGGRGTLAARAAARSARRGPRLTVEVRFLGSGNAFSDGGRSHACILVTAPEGRILLDCGGSALPAITRVCDPSTIDAAAVTHLHGDHFGGLPFLAMQQKYAPRRRPLVFAGPPSLERTFGQVATGLYSDFFETPLPYDLSFVVLGDRAVRLGPAEVSAHPVWHVESSEPHGLRVRVGGRTIAYSGDASWGPQLPALADGADLFICESTTYETRDPVHLSVKELLAHRGELHAERIVVTHLGKETLAHLADLGIEHADDGTTIAL